MRRAAWTFLGPGCALALLLVCYRAVLFEGEQFSFRDAGGFYYPLYLRVQQEWQAGRWPLWDPWQNGGQPLLGSPMAAVLYPGKLLYAALPYAWAARLYVVAHTALAYFGMLALARSLGISWVGANLGGLSYAFGAPVLFQYSNVIYLVGAAWMPWGLRAVDRLVRLGRRSGVAELAVILALEVLGGDPQAAWLTVLCGAGFALYLVLREGPWPDWAQRAVRPLALGLAGVWLVAPPVLAFWRLALPGGVGSLWLPALLAWAIAGGWVVRRWARHPQDRLAPRLAGLAGAGMLALSIAAAQVVPTVEFLAVSSRLNENRVLNRFKFSVEPYRLVELIWPGFFGQIFPVYRSWLPVISPALARELWEPSLYVGGLALLLFLGAAGFREGPPWRAWLTALALVSVVASFGRFGSALWWVRLIPGAEVVIGSHDPLNAMPRTDRYPTDGAGSPYALLVALLPGFGLFRYPAKLFTLTAAAVAVLAGSGWDEVTAGRSKRLARVSLLGLAASALALAWRGRLILLAQRTPSDILAGPLDVTGAWADTQFALVQGMLVCAAGLALARWAPRYPRRVGACALIALAFDLGLANAGIVWTAPQSTFDDLPEAARRIAAAERAEPSPGPFRIHRMVYWYPDRFLERRSRGRAGELLAWERGTLQPHHALSLGLETCLIKGLLELDEYLTLFNPSTLRAGRAAADALGIAPGQTICYFPRRSFDLWGARYFILPVRPLGWENQERGFASFGPDTEVLYPDPAKLGGPAGKERWARQEDWQLVRNKAAYPRAWLVHDARLIAPVTDPAARAELARELSFMNDPFWSDPKRPVHDLRALAWIETDDRRTLRKSIARGAVEPGESVTVTRHEPQRVELSARLNRPGIVILADTDYPGWHLTIDGRPAPIYRTNGMMRGASVLAGEHTLVYVFDPASFRIGLALSLAGLAMLLILIVRHSRGRPWWPDRSTG